MMMSSVPPSGSNEPSSAGFNQPSKVRAPRSRRSPVRIESQAASSGAVTGTSASWTDELVAPPCTGSRLPLFNSPRRDKRVCARRTPSRGVHGSFSLLPPARIRTRKDRSETVRDSFQVPFFHGSEIKALDKGIAGKVEQDGGKQGKTRLFSN